MSLPLKDQERMMCLYFIIFFQCCRFMQLEVLHVKDQLLEAHPVVMVSSLKNNCVVKNKTQAPGEGLSWE